MKNKNRLAREAALDAAAVEHAPGYASTGVSQFSRNVSRGVAGVDDGLIATRYQWPSLCEKTLRCGAREISTNNTRQMDGDEKRAEATMTISREQICIC